MVMCSVRLLSNSIPDGGLLLIVGSDPPCHFLMHGDCTLQPQHPILSLRISRTQLPHRSRFALLGRRCDLWVEGALASLMCGRRGLGDGRRQLLPLRERQAA